MGQEPAYNAGDTGNTGSISWLGRSPGGGHSCLEKSTDRGDWWTIVQGIAKSQTQLSACTHTHIHTHTNLEPRVCNWFWNNWIQEVTWETSLVAQGIRIHMPEQGTWVWPLVPEDSTCGRSTKSTHHNYLAHALQLLKARGPWSPRSATRGATTMRSSHTTTKSSPCSP